MGNPSGLDPQNFLSTLLHTSKKVNGQEDHPENGVGYNNSEFDKLCDAADVVDGCVVRQPKAYPVYDDSYRDNLAMIRLDLNSSYPTLHLVGRNGMHKYNNQDHSMMTAMLAAKNIIAGKELFDLWDVNEDAEYHEGGDRGAEETEKVLGRLVPEKIN